MYIQRKPFFSAHLSWALVLAEPSPFVQEGRGSRYDIRAKGALPPSLLTGDNESKKRLLRHWRPKWGARAPYPPPPPPGKYKMNKIT